MTDDDFIGSGFGRDDAGWVVDSNTALEFSLVRDASTLKEYKSYSNSDDGHDVGDEDGDASGDMFHPDFTYPLYGEEEKIFGFRGLAVKLHFAAASLRPWISVEYDEKRPAANVHTTVLAPIFAKLFPSSGEDENDSESVDALTLRGKEWTDSRDQFASWLEEDARSWRPLGEKVHEYTVAGNVDADAPNGSVVYEVYKATFETAGFREYHRRLQPFLLWYIEGASYIDDSDSRWEIYVIYEKHDEQYAVVGYATCYPFFHYPDNIRMRISQYIVFPPYQGAGHGGALYRFLYQSFLADPKIADITVEDPSEGFSDMRVKNDLRLLLQDRALAPLSPASTPSRMPTADQIAAVAKKYKFSRQHMVQLAELYALKFLKATDVQERRKYRIWVKKRIYRKNEEVLEEIGDEAVVKQKLAETFKNVESDYRRLLNVL